MREKIVIVLDSNGCFLENTHPAMARKLLKEGQAKIYAREPFAIQLNRSVESPNRQLRNQETMSQIQNYTEFFKEERDIYIQNISGCQVSVTFQTGPGQFESYLFPNTKDPVNLTRFVPFQAVKNSHDLRKLLNRVPPALLILSETEFNAYFSHQATKSGVTVDQALEAAEQRRSAVQNHTPLADAPDPIKLHEVVEDGKHLGERKIVRSLETVSAEEEINPRVLNLCLQVNPALTDQQKMTAAQLLSELDVMGDLTLIDWEYVRSHGFYKSVKNLAKKKADELALASSEPEDAPKKPAPKAKKVKAAVVKPPESV
jgi:hypothetical protein